MCCWLVAELTNPAPVLAKTRPKENKNNRVLSAPGAGYGLERRCPSHGTMQTSGPGPTQSVRPLVSRGDAKGTAGERLQTRCRGGARTREDGPRAGRRTPGTVLTDRLPRPPRPNGAGCPPGTPALPWPHAALPTAGLTWARSSIYTWAPALLLPHSFLTAGPDHSHVASGKAPPLYGLRFLVCTWDGRVSQDSEMITREDHYRH